MANRPRKFAIVDGAILIAALAIGLGLLRMTSTVADLGPLYATLTGSPPWDWPADRVAVRVSDLIGITFPVTALATVGLLVPRLIPPRPGRRRLARQPGFVACAAFSTAASLTYAGAFLCLVLREGANGLQILNLGPLLAIQHGGWAVAACWLLLAFAGRWRPEPSWIDRAGRFLGLCWIGTALIQTDVMVALFLAL